MAILILFKFYLLHEITVIQRLHQNQIKLYKTECKSAVHAFFASHFSGMFMRSLQL